MDSKQALFEKSANFVKEEIESQVEILMQLRKSIDIKNSELLGDNLLVHRGIHQDIKNKVTQCQKNVRKIIYGTAYFVQENEFRSMDEVFSALHLESKRDTNRAAKLTHAQKNINLSFGTFQAVLEVFKKINTIVLEEINQDNSSSKQKNELLLKNSILTYEITSFAIDFFGGFRLNGIKDLEELRQEVLEDVSENRRNDRILRDMATKSKNLAVLKSIDDREAFRCQVEDRWHEMINTFKAGSSHLSTVNDFMERLKIAQMNAKNTIDILNIAATTMVVYDSIQAIKAMADGMGDWKMPELDKTLTCQLLNLDFTEH